MACGPSCGCESGKKSKPSLAKSQNPFENLDDETKMKIQELQILEQNFQQMMMQKNAFTAELRESDMVISEVEKAKGEISRVVGPIIVKSTKEEVLRDMKQRKKFLEDKNKDVVRQEENIAKRIESLREEVLKKIQKQ